MVAIATPMQKWPTENDDTLISVLRHGQLMMEKDRGRVSERERESAWSVSHVQFVEFRQLVSNVGESWQLSTGNGMMCHGM